MNQDSITIHTFSPIVQCQDQPSESDSDSAKEDAFLLSRGRSVLHAGCHTMGWQTPNARELEDSCLNNAFIYLPVPPLVPVVGALLTGGTMKEWDTRPSVSEKFSIVELEPFESALFYSQHSRPPGVLKECRNRRSSGSCTPRRPPTKRKKVEEDMGPLDEIIAPITFPLLSSHRIPHCPVFHLIFPLLSSLFRPKTSLRLMLSSHPYIPVLPG